MADFGRDPRSSDSSKGSRFFCLFGHINNARFHRFPVYNFTNFAHNNVDRCRDVNFPNKILKILSLGVAFPKNAKISRKCSKSGDFRPPELRNDNRSPETHGQISTACLVSILLVVINSKSFAWSVHSVPRIVRTPAPTVSLLMIGCRLRTMRYIF